MTKKNCIGCYNDDYNHGFGGAKECWSFKNAKIGWFKLIHVDQVPPWTQKAVRLPNCYTKSRYVKVGKDVTR